MKYNKVIVAGLLAVAIGLSAGCSTKATKDTTKVYADTIIECKDFAGIGNNNAEGVHRDPIRMSYRDCMERGGNAGFYNYPVKERKQ